MHDSEVVASIVAGDPDGLAEAYDRYANALFGYCRSLLSEPADAADAVQDTFVIAASRLSGLRDPELLRPWLYAVARNECLRRLKSREAATVPGDAEQADETVDIGGEAERAETRALLRAAVGGLNPAERDVITQLLYGLDIAEIALVLGISRNHAHALFSRARHQLEASVGVLIVARTGRQDCKELDAMLTGWDGLLTVPLRRQAGRHIEKCPICSDRRRRELTPAMLLGLSPGALLGAFAAAHAIPGQAAPASLRDQALQMAGGKDPHAQAHRDALLRSHRSFSANGFPKPLPASRHVLPRVPHAQVGTVAGVLAVAAAAAIVLAMLTGRHNARFSSGGPLSGGRQSSAQPRGAASGTVPGASSGQSGPASPGASSSGSGGSQSPSPNASPTGTATSATPTVSGSPAPTPTRTPPTTAPPTTAPPTTVPPTTPPPTTAPPTTPPPTTPPPTTPPPTTPPPTTPPPTTPPPAAGTLTVSPLTIVVTPLLGSTITLTAENGPVNWSISEPSSLLGELIVSPSSGTLAAGQSAQVTVTVSGLASLDTQLTVNPGGQQVTVLVGLGLAAGMQARLG